MIRIPNPDSERPWFQDNRGDGRGSINQSFNLDLASNLGKVRTTRAKRLAYTGTPENFGQVAAMEKFGGKLYVSAESDAGHDIWVGGQAPFDTLTNDATSVEIAPAVTDMLAWNNGLYVTNATEIYYTTDGTAYSEVGSNVLTSGEIHLLTAKNDILYVSNHTGSPATPSVHSVTQANSFQNSGAQTIDLDIPGYVITVLMAGIDSIWIGVSSTELGQPCFMFEWDGETANTPSARYEVNATAILAGTVKDGVPYIVDSNGRLLAFQGGYFAEVARFPLNGGTFNQFDNPVSGAIHPRGMGVDGDEILINIANRTEDVLLPTHNEFPSGVWAYSQDNGLYHKLSPSYQAVADTGTTNLTDYGQFRCAEAGPLLVFESTNDGGGVGGAANNGGRVIFAMQYYSDATTSVYGLFADDTPDNTQKAGWYISPKIPSSKFRDAWEKIYPAISDLETTGDLVELKYRTKDHTPTYCVAEWTGTDRFNTDTELSAYEEGDEVTVVNGKGSGALAHALNVSFGAGSEVVLDRNLTGISSGNTSRVRLDKWKKIGKVENADVFNRGYGVGVADHWIQVKLYLQWTGPRELYSVLINNIASI